MSERFSPKKAAAKTWLAKTNIAGYDSWPWTKGLSEKQMERVVESGRELEERIRKMVVSFARLTAEEVRDADGE